MMMILMIMRDHFADCMDVEKLKIQTILLILTY